MSRDFSKGKIYKITNDYNNDIYVGSTCDTLGRRFSRHKSDSKKEKYKHYKLYKLMNEIGFERFRIQLIINYPCEDIYQLTQKEGEYIRLLGTLNQRVEGRTQKEYKQKPEYKKYKKQYDQQPKVKQYHQKYQQTPERKEYRGEKIVCECGCSIRRSDISTHKKTKKHLDLMEQLNNNPNNEVVV